MSSRRSVRRPLVALLVGVLVGGGLMAVTPAGAEVSNAVATNWKKIWNKELKPQADQRYYTKKKSNKRYYTKSDSDAKYQPKGNRLRLVVHQGRVRREVRRCRLGVHQGRERREVRADPEPIRGTYMVSDSVPAGWHGFATISLRRRTLLSCTRQCTSSRGGAGTRGLPGHRRGADARPRAPVHLRGATATNAAPSRSADATRRASASARPCGASSSGARHAAGTGLSASLGGCGRRSPAPTAVSSARPAPSAGVRPGGVAERPSRVGTAAARGCGGRSAVRADGRGVYPRHVTQDTATRPGSRRVRSTPATSPTR